MADIFSSLQKHINDLQDETLEYFDSLSYSESYEDKVYESKLINETIESKRKWINKILSRFGSNNLLEWCFWLD